MESLNQKINHLNQLILDGKALEAFELYYDDEVVMQENEGMSTSGKAANRQREVEFFNNIAEFRSAHVSATAITGDTSFVKWHFDYTHKEWGVRNYTQVSVQNWKDGKIIREQFFYGN